MWYIFALLSACSSTMRRAVDKQLSHKLNALTHGWTMQLFSLPVMIVAQLLSGQTFSVANLGTNFWIPTFVASVVLYPLFNCLYLKAIKEGELSKILPLQSLTPLFAVITGRLLLGQTPAPLAFFGILIVVIGVYVLNLKGRYLHNPLKVLSADKPNMYMIAGVAIIAVAATCDKLAMQASDPISYSLVSTVMSFLTLFAMSVIKRANNMTLLRKLAKPIIVTGTLSGLSFLLYALALRTGPLAYVSTIKGTSIFMGSILGLVYFNEELTKPKTAALALIAVGSVVLGLAA